MNPKRDNTEYAGPDAENSGRDKHARESDKDRDKYVSGEHRWRKGYCKSNPRKMVKVWAEKEMRNYRRLFDSGIKCPEPVLLTNHVLVMEFLGDGGWPAPRIRDANLSEKRLREAYVSTLSIMRRMFQVSETEVFEANNNHS